VLVLFSVGSSKGKWGTLLEALIEFKRLYDAEATLSEVLPELVAEFPESYSSNQVDGTPIFVWAFFRLLEPSFLRCNDLLAARFFFSAWTWYFG